MYRNNLSYFCIFYYLVIFFKINNIHKKNHATNLIRYNKIYLLVKNVRMLRVHKVLKI